MGRSEKRVSRRQKLPPKEPLHLFFCLVNSMAEFADYVLFDTTGAKKVDVSPDMMEYAFVDGCADPATLQAILTALKEGQYGYYPHVCF